MVPPNKVVAPTPVHSIKQHDSWEIHAQHRRVLWIHFPLYFFFFLPPFLFLLNAAGHIFLTVEQLWRLSHLPRSGTEGTSILPSVAARREDPSAIVNHVRGIPNLVINGTIIDLNQCGYPTADLVRGLHLLKLLVSLFKIQDSKVQLRFRTLHLLAMSLLVPLKYCRGIVSISQPFDASFFNFQG